MWIHDMQRENAALRTALKELWQAVQKSNDPQSPDFIPASLPMFRVADDIAERYPFVKEADSEPAA
jgi:hypothetical protein